MSLAVVSSDEFDAYRDQLDKSQADLLEQLQQLRQQVADLSAKPQEWYTKADANTFYKNVRTGKPVDRHTFSKWIDIWLRDGKLKEGVNFQQLDTTCLIRADFIAGVPLPKKVEMKIV